MHDMPHVVMSRPFVRAMVLLQVMFRSRFAQALTRSEGAGEVHMVKATAPSDFAEGSSGSSSYPLLLFTLLPL